MRWKAVKKLSLALLVAVFIVGFFVYINKLYYPEHPIESLSAKEILHKLNTSDEEVVKLAEENNYIWYITKSHNIDSKMDVDEKIINMVHAKGWSYQNKMGSGLFFEKDGEKLIITTEMWTSKYVLIQVPSNY